MVYSLTNPTNRQSSEDEEANELALIFVKNLHLGNSMAQLYKNAFMNFQA
jgi:hypothetical protein|tara:strand:- start:552 stop:701 length:150 start_codon:yes stop_codon:yes gene_type:complete